MANKLSFPIKLVLFLLLVSLMLIGITFAFEGWLVDNSTKNSYGIWRACLASTSICASWSDYTLILINFALSGYYTAFQILQCVMLGLVAISFASLGIGTQLCARDVPMIGITLIAVIFGMICGGVSLILYGTQIYNPNSTNLNWCYWVSITAVGLQAISSIFHYVHLIQVNDKKNRKLNALITAQIESALMSNMKKEEIDMPISPIINAAIVEVPEFDEKFTTESAIMDIPPALSNNNGGAKLDKYRSKMKSKMRPCKQYWNKIKYYKYRHISDNDVPEKQMRRVNEVDEFLSGYYSEPNEIENSLQRYWSSVRPDGYYGTSHHTSVPDLMHMPPLEPITITGVFRTDEINSSRSSVRLPRLALKDNSIYEEDRNDFYNYRPMLARKQIVSEF